MCPSIEEYAIERAVDAVIRACIHFDQTKEETIKYIKSKYETLSETYILERVNKIWKDNSNEEL